METHPGATAYPHADASAETLRRLRLLTEATPRIGASLDAAEIARVFGQVAVPAIADMVAVYLLETLVLDDAVERDLPGRDDAAFSLVRRVATVAADEHGGCAEMAPEGAPQILLAGSPGRRAMAAGEPILVAGAAVLALPLLARGRTLGCAVLRRRQGRPPFSELDVLTLRQLAGQASLGVDNARMFRGEAAIADELQRSMLPPQVAPLLPGVEIAQRYLPGSRSAQVGGDWFDALPMPGSRVALVVGDVMGHGIASAAMMGQLRTAVRTLTALDLPPDEVLRHLDDLAQRLGERYLATCVYAVYDPVARRCSLASAGHIPPVRRRCGGTAELLDIPAGAPIGVGGVPFKTVEIEAADGDLLVLCTDGLVEKPGEDIGAGLDALCAAVTTHGRSLDQLCDKLLREVRPEQRRDDVALLVAKMRGVASEDIAHWLLTPRPSTPSRARALTRRTLAGWGLADCAPITELLVSELVSNAVRYARRPIELRLLRTNVLICEVTDDDHHLPTLDHAGETDEAGRGLSVVSQLAQRWGASRTATGKVVWFEQSLPG